MQQQAFAAVQESQPEDVLPAERERRSEQYIPHKWQYRAADNPRFAALIAGKEHPTGLTALGGIDVCDVPLPVRRAE